MPKGIYKRRFAVWNKGIKYPHPTHKKCCHCKEIKSIQEFDWSKAKDGYAYICKPCRRKAVKAYSKSLWNKCKVDPVLKKKRYALYKKWTKTLKGTFYHLEFSAKKRGIEFFLSEDEKKKLFNSERRCHYCGIEENDIVLLPSFKFGIKSLTVDRKDNSLGYIDGNCVLSCPRCNDAKGMHFSYVQFIEIAKKYFKMED